jgi:hypothetical protein
MSGFTSDRMSAIPGVAASGFTKEQIENFTTANSYSGCGGLTADQMSNITADAYEGFTPQCVAVIPASSFAGVGIQVGKLLDATTISLSIDQLAALTPRGISGLRPTQLELLVYYWNNTFIELYSNDEWSLYPTESIILFKDMIFVVVFPMYVLPPSNSVENVTWIELSLTVLDPTPELDAQTIENLNPMTISGIRMDQVKLLSDSAIAAISIHQAVYLLSDTMSVFNGTQIQAITVDAFGAIPHTSLAFIDPLVIPYITTAQVAKLSPTVMDSMTCDQLTNFTKPQIDAMTTETKNAFDTHLSSCINPTTTSTTATTTSSSSTTGDIVIVSSSSGG